jgi:hypothetical protein
MIPLRTFLALSLGTIALACPQPPANAANTAVNSPIALHPDNPRYFVWRGQPTVLVTSAEHYGAVLNLDFDYRKYLDTLAANNLNYTRVFSGAYVEPQGAFNITRNTLAPLPNRFICPWPRSDQPGYANGGNKFDLSQWDPAYFARLLDFVGYASQRGVVVEMTLFCPMYEEMQWRLSPMNAANNVNHLASVARTNVHTLDRHGGLLPFQEALTRKIVTELNPFDNVFFELCNEPYFGGVTLEWQHHIANLIAQTEQSLPNQHLIAQNIANQSARIQNPHPAISIFNFHYATPPDVVALNYHLAKVIGDDETGFRGTRDTAYRTEGWDFIIAGGALYNNLDYSFAAGYEDGTFAYPPSQPGGGNPAFRRQMQILSRFIHGFDFIRMKPDNSIITGASPAGGTARALVDPNRAIAIYVRSEGSTGPWSARWTGYLEAPSTGTYTFHTFSNDGIRLWVNDQLIVEDWTDHGEKEDTGLIALTAGQRYPIRMEYFYNGGQGASKLWWTPPNGAKAPIPANAFRLPHSTGWGVRGEYFRGTDLTQPWFQRDDGQINFAYGVKPPVSTGTTSGAATLEINLAPGQWHAEWLDTKSGLVTHQTTISGGGNRSLTAPPFDTDIALRLVRQ